MIDFNMLNKIVKNKRLNYFIIIFVLIFTLIGMVFYKVSILDLMKYLSFQVFYILIPGMLIFRMLKIKDVYMDKIIISYGIGIILVIIEYFLCYFMNIKNALYLIGPILTAIELTVHNFYNTNKKKIRINQMVYNFEIQIVTIFSILFFITFIAFTLSNPLPDLIGKSNYDQDLLWLIGNTQSLLRKFQPIDSRLSYVPFKYHYFLSTYLAVISYVTKIDTVKLFFQFSQIGNLGLLIYSTFLLGKTYFRNSKKGIFFTLIYFFSNCASSVLALKNNTGVFLNINFAHLTWNPFGFGLGISFMFLCITILIKQMREEKLNLGYLFLTSIFLMGTTGTKAPLGAILVSVFFVMSVILIAQKRFSKNLLIYFMCLSVSFCIVYIYFIIGGDSSLKLYLGYTVKSTIIGNIINNMIGNSFLNNILIAMAIPIHFILFLPFASIPFIIWFYYNFKNIKQVEIADLMIGGLAICGIILTYIFSHFGHSEIYFIMGSIPFIELCALQWLNNNYFNLKLVYRRVFILTFIISISTTFFITLGLGYHGLRKVYMVYSKSQYEQKSDYNSITKYEYEGMRWINIHTPSNSIIAGDRYYYDKNAEESNARYFYYSTFSQRQFYLEGWYYHYEGLDYHNEFKSYILKHKIKTMQNFYKEKSESIDELKNENVSYVIVSQFSNPNFKVFDNRLQLIFKNRDIKIFKIN